MNATKLMRPVLVAAILWIGGIGFLRIGLAQTPEPDGLIRGKLRWEVYEGIPGVTLEELKTHPKYPGNPDFVGWLDEFETPEQWGDNYGARVTGFVIPPLGGEYVFSIASDDQGELYLSPDADPVNKVLIAAEPMWSPPRIWLGRDPGQTESKRSAPISLQAGRRYYVEALLKEAGGMDHLGVTWQMPGQPAVENGAPPIPGEHLATWATPQPPTPESELHVVCVYSGRTAEGGASRDHEPGEVSVRVDRPGRVVTLLLCSYEPAMWQVFTTPDTLVERVILQGYYEQSVLGLPPEVEILSRWHQDGPGPYFWIGHEVDSSRFYRSVPKIHELTGLEIASFHGAYTAPHPEPFVLDQVQDDPRLRSDYPQPLPPDQVPRLGFQMAFYREQAPSQVGKIFIRDCVLTGLQDNVSLLPAERMAMDAYRPLYYGAAHNRVWSVYGVSNEIEELMPGPGVPEFSWATGATFDRERDRLLVATLGGVGYLYAYSPAAREWSLVADMAGRDLDCLEYHDREDCLYGVTTSHMDAVKPVILRLSAEGVPLGETPLPVFPFDIGSGGYRSELVSMGDYLALLLEPDLRFLENQDILESRIYLFDPRSEELRLTYRRMGLAGNQPPSVGIVAPSEWDSFVQGDLIRIRAAAHDPDGEVSSVDILANGPRVGVAERIPGSNLFELAWPATLAGDVHLVAEARDNGGARAMSVPVWVTIHPTPPGFVTRRFVDINFDTRRVQVELSVQPVASTQAVAIEDRPPPGWQVSGMSHDGTYDPVTARVKFGPFFDHQPRVLAYTVHAPPGAAGVFRFVGRGSADGVNSSIVGEQELVFVGYHPADRAPRDWQLLIEEVTAYGAAWRKGDEWPVPPNPIPMDYVTWAAVLWRSGERYQFEPLIHEAPHWWVVDPQLQLDATRTEGIARQSTEPSSTAIRTLTSTGTSGDAWPVCVTARPAPGTRAYAVEEQLPEGYAPGDISLGGHFNPQKRTIRWGPFADGGERQLTYQVSAKRASPPPLNLSGRVSFDGISQAVTGLASIRPGSILQLDLDAASKHLRISISGDNASGAILETSSDLRNWQRVSEIPLPGDVLEIDPQSEEAGSPRFYRLRYN